MTARSPTAYEHIPIKVVQKLERLRAATGASGQCIERVLEIYRMALERGLTNGWSSEAMAAAMLYMACRLLETPLTLNELIKNAKAPGYEIRSCYRLLVRGLGIKPPAIDPAALIPKIAERLRLPGDVVEAAIEVLRRAKEEGITAGKTPLALAATAIYAVVRLRGIPVMQKEVAAAAGVSKVIIRSRYKQFIEIYKRKIVSSAEAKIKYRNHYHKRSRLAELTEPS